MHAVFVASLFGGAVAIVLFALLGLGGGHAGGHGHGAHAGHGTHPVHGTAGNGHATAQHHASSGQGASPARSPLSLSLGWALGWLSPLTIAGAALWFGAAGLLLEGISTEVAVLAAVIAAVVGAMLVRAVMASFIRASTPPLQLTGDGAIATVNAAIRDDTPGEVLYTLEGLHRSMPARSVDGTPIPRGTPVVIVRREKGMAWVEPLDPLADLGPGQGTPLAGTTEREPQDG